MFEGISHKKKNKLHEPNIKRDIWKHLNIKREMKFLRFLTNFQHTKSINPLWGFSFFFPNFFRWFLYSFFSCFYWIIFWENRLSIM